ncbi:hypothetical protein BV22DRAFT_1165010 [Leucogyrophana mollusca]|uniref:Uncharacterized protein n=1 Tax=Leucogyrophana mollusca TaxID=85980 RepID=A0ACB8BF56_9AGAM|nr:hypothetical protein BV22DRAFT_1165010 [Leucogyrophana mollusca]
MSGGNPCTLEPSSVTQTDAPKYRDLSKEQGTLFATQVTLGKFVEFIVVNNERTMPPCLGYLAKVEGAIASSPSSPGVGLVHPQPASPKPGTFGDFREWKIGMENSGVGQIIGDRIKVDP